MEASNVKFDPQGHLNDHHYETKGRLVSETIDNFLEESNSISIDNITPEVEPVVVEKIVSKSNTVLVVDSDGKIFDDYSNIFRKYIANNHKLTVYSKHNPFPETRKKCQNFHFVELNDKSIENLHNSQIRNVIIGDNLRFILQKTSKIPHFESIVGAFLSLFNLGNYHKEITYESRTNFGNKDQARNLAAKITSLVN